MAAVVIGVYPVKRSNTIEVIDSDEAMLVMARFENTRADYRTMRALVKRWPDRVGVRGDGQAVSVSYVCCHYAEFERVVPSDSASAGLGRRHRWERKAPAK